MAAADTTVRLRVAIRGAVQGVGFRPFVYRLATARSLCGWIRNTGQGVLIEVEGTRIELDRFLYYLEHDCPPRAVVQGLEHTFLDPIGHGAFEILASEGGGATSALVLPDIAPCAECLREMHDPKDRRHRYPFTNCTHCGPRYSIIEALPYDRQNTTMRTFPMCPACAGEYHDPRNRRFHAQPVACADCGPQLALWDSRGKTQATRDDALRAAAHALGDGRILALKGVGGFQLLVDARNEDAVQRLRDRKHRYAKPFAVMFSTLDAAASVCRVSRQEARLLQSPEAPIVILARGEEAGAIVEPVAPGNPNLGVMLPSSPLHHLLLRETGFPLVATSGNLNGEPICTGEQEALARLEGITDLLLVHDRPITRHVDDSVLRVMLGRELMLRRARGYAPLPLHVAETQPAILAMGAHLKNTIALSHGKDIFLSQHIGDLESPQACAALAQTAADLCALYGAAPEAVACDLHPDYRSTRHAQAAGLPCIAVQHHHAHVLACMADNDLRGSVLGVAWDGTGYGTDGTIWGGEFLHVTESGYARVAHLRPFRLPGGDAAVREPRRCALSLCYELFGDAAFSEDDPPALRRMIAAGINAPYTSSAGRLFDAAASLLNLQQHQRFEGQAAMALEFITAEDVEDSYPIEVDATVDWRPLFLAMLADPAPNAIRAARFHNTLAEAILLVALRAGEARVVLSGGCFQNRYLTERTVRRLCEEGFQPYWHQRIPPNDGGIALGQAVGAARALHAAEVQKEQIGRLVAVQ